MTGGAVPATRNGHGDDRDSLGRGPPGAGIGRAVALIAALTILARVLGVVRTLVFSQTVGAGCLGTAYNTANLVPNIVYDIVLGGALTSIMVPVLARPADRVHSRGDPAAAAEVNQTSSALLTWTVIVLVPVSAAVAVAAGPLARLLNPRNATSGCGAHQQALVSVTGHMLAVFAPQIVLYGLAVALYGILQAHRRFGAPALAPVISSLVVIGAYLAFVPLGGDYRTSVNLSGLPLSAELMLSVGTTAGVAAMAVTALVPAWRLRIRVRPALRFPAGVGRRAGGLAAYGIAALLTQDLAALVVILLANARGDRGALVLYGYGWQFFETGYAVLAISIAVSAFPALSVRVGDEFDRTAVDSARAVLLACFAGTALLIAIAWPAAHFLRTYPGQVPQLAAAFALFAPGLAGYGLVASQSRVLLAAGRTTLAAVIVGGGWLLVIGADVGLVMATSVSSAVPMMALGNTIGLTAAGAALVVVVRRTRGRAALRGTLRAALSGLAAAAAGAGAGAAVAAAVPAVTRVQAALAAVAAAACALAVFGAVAFVLDGPELRALIARVHHGILP